MGFWKPLAKKNAKQRAKREGGGWKDYYDEELAKIRETMQKGKQELEDLLTNANDPAKQKAVSATLDSMSREELEIHYSHTQLEIEEAEARLTPLLEIRNRPKPQSTGEKVFYTINEAAISAARNYILKRKKLLATIEVRLKRPTPAPLPKPAEDPDEEIIKEMKRLKEKEASLLADETDPDIREEIQRVFRKKLDKLREKL